MAAPEEPHAAVADVAVAEPENRILFWMCVLVAVNQLGFGAMIPSLPLYAQSFGVPASAVGIAVAVYGLARFFSAVPAGKLADKFGRRYALAAGGLISGLGNLWCATAHSFPEFIIARFVAGFGAGLVVTTGQIVLADITTPERRGRMLALYQGTFIFAVGIGPFPGGLLAEHFGLAAPFFASGLAALGAMSVAWFFVTETREMALAKSGKGAQRLKLGFVEQLRLLTAKIGFALISVIVLMAAIVRTGGMFTVIPIIAKERIGASVSQIGFALMLGSVSGLVTSYPLGWITDRFGRKAVIVPATLISGSSMLLYCVAPNYPWFVAASIVWGIAISAIGTAPAAYAADSAPAGMNAAAMSTFRMIADLGYVAGPLALGLIADGLGASTALVIAAALVIGAGVAFALFAPETYRGKSGSSGSA
ncbi:MAG: MFS transporter [Proteobacteria bacterium]|nr:MFS transporter [Pseudomonadota bacterium]